MLGIQHSKSTGSLNVTQNVQNTPAKLSLPPVTAQGERSIVEVLRPDYYFHMILKN